uniref:DDE-1 domain-containing protein n=1 Tax=Anopheles funestus TaxID=62324 RepID=A0A182S0A9_ANOFN
MHKKKVRLTRAKELLRLAKRGELPNLVFSDEKPFVIQQFVNKSAENLHLRLATRTQKPVVVMVWAAITADGRSPLVFIDSGDSAASHSARATQEWLRNE